MMMNAEEIMAFVERRLEQHKEEQKKEFDAKLVELEEKIDK